MFIGCILKKKKKNLWGSNIKLEIKLNILFFLTLTLFLAIDTFLPVLFVKYTSRVGSCHLVKNVTSRKQAKNSHNH